MRLEKTTKSAKSWAANWAAERYAKVVHQDLLVLFFGTKITLILFFTFSKTTKSAKSWAANWAAERYAKVVHQILLVLFFGTKITLILFFTFSKTTKSAKSWAANWAAERYTNLCRSEYYSRCEQVTIFQGAKKKTIKCNI
jgi:hypothetical protein